jgi:hypothetical protein
VEIGHYHTVFNLQTVIFVYPKFIYFHAIPPGEAANLLVGPFAFILLYEIEQVLLSFLGFYKGEIIYFFVEVLGETSAFYVVLVTEFFLFEILVPLTVVII